MDHFNFMSKKTLLSFKMAFLIIVGVTVFSTILIRKFEGIGWLDSFFLVIDSMTHAHFGGYPKMTGTKVVMSFLTIFGVGILVYVISIIVDIIFSEEILEVMGTKGIDKKLKSLDKHIIICGYGRVGSVIGEELLKSKISFAVIDKDDTLVERLCKDGILAIQGESSDIETLKRVGVAKANFLVMALGDDSETIVTILAAKELNPRIRIIARASDERLARRMLQIGAERIVMPEHVGGVQIAESLLHKHLRKDMGLLTKDNL
ncbi:MAG: potassium channel family protein [Candidatus Methanofastidiosia archaeon]